VHSVSVIYVNEERWDSNEELISRIRAGTSEFNFRDIMLISYEIRISDEKILETFNSLKIDSRL